MNTSGTRRTGAVSRAPGFDLRHEERVEAALPVSFEDGRAGTTCNVSAKGIYVEVRERVRLGSPIGIVIEFQDQPGGPVRMRGRAQVLRVEALAGGWGVAAAVDWHAQ